MASEIVSNDIPLSIPLEAIPNVEHLVTEDDTPVDNIFAEKQQRLLPESLHSSWTAPGDGKFVALANVGLFYTVEDPPFVPDVLVSLGVELPGDLQPKINRCYFIWRYGKSPDIVVEVVSNRKGGEDTHKIDGYARIGVRYYAIFDPDRRLGDEVLRVYRLEGTAYKLIDEPYRFPGIELGLTLWEGRYEDHDGVWLRWTDFDGNLIATSAERAEQEHQRAEREYQRAEREYQRAEKLAEKLRSLGGDPDV